MTHDAKSAPRFGRAGASSTPPPFAPAPFLWAAAHPRRKHSMRREERPGASAHRSRNLRSASANDAGHFCRTFSLFSERCGPLFTRGPLKNGYFCPFFAKSGVRGPLVDRLWTASGPHPFLAKYQVRRGKRGFCRNLVDRMDRKPFCLRSTVLHTLTRENRSDGPHGPDAVI